jgi:gliding motility-associated-like protein
LSFGLSVQKIISNNGVNIQTGMRFLSTLIMSRQIFLAVVCITLWSAAAAEDDPEIKGQRPLVMNEGESITIQLSDLIVDPNKSAYPKGFYIEILEGDHYTFSGATVTPDSNFSGKLEVHLRVNDGTRHSKKFNLKISVLKKEQVNIAPLIVGQFPVTGEQNKPVTISLSQLIVVDPDSRYPQDFRLKILPGNYSVDKDKVTPPANFSGILTVSVIVNDGKADSQPFQMKVIITENKKNTKPVITGQVDLTTTKNKTIAIQLPYLTVADPDNSFPSDFQLTIYPGTNYTSISNAVTPGQNFVGMLTVNVSVNDGRDQSDIYPLKINVTEENNLRIVGQQNLIMLEDSTLTLNVSVLIVNDPNEKFPNGFSLTVLPGEQYSIEEQTIRSAKNFSGNLKVNVQLIRGSEIIQSYNLVVVVLPVNDPPTLTWDAGPIQFTKEKSPLALASDAVVGDPDNENLQSAEIAFSFDSYQKGNDIVTVQKTSQLTTIFDANTGTLYLLGSAPLSEYQQAIRTLQYNFKTLGDTIPFYETKPIFIKLFDGELYSQSYEKDIVMLEDIPLEIPTGFTPNNDNANDTWFIKPLSNSSALENAVLRVFTRRGVKVFETTGFEKAWDGRLDGELLPADSYFYTVEIQSAFRRINKSGVVTLLR